LDSRRERVAALRERLPEGRTQSLIQTYAPNVEVEYATFLEEVGQTLERLPPTDSILLMGDFNARVGTQVERWGDYLLKYSFITTETTFNLN
jgi:endonuclease/exonuclease/phosphatase (EEP) superfamily protein YafD